MLPRVTSTLSRFLSPLISRGQPTPAQNKQIEIHPIAPGRSQNNPAAPQTFTKNTDSLDIDSLVSLDSPDTPSDSSTSDDPSSEKQKPTLRVVSSKSDQPKIPETLFSLVSLFQGQPGRVMRWFGIKSYRNSGRTQKKGGRFKKGTIFDQQS